jgi:hypothetical protein
MTDRPRTPNLTPETQVSPWLGDLTQSVMLTFTDVGTGRPIVRVVATNQNPNLGSRYRPGTEYWHAVSGMPQCPSLSMKFEHDSWEASDIDAFLADLPPALELPQQAAGLWTSNKYASTAPLVERRYVAPDPDDWENPSGLQIGLLFAFDPAGGLAQVGWYKSGNPVTGNVWGDHSSPEHGLSWTLAPSFDRLAWSVVQGRVTPPR